MNITIAYYLSIQKIELQDIIKTTQKKMDRKIAIRFFPIILDYISLSN